MNTVAPQLSAAVNPKVVIPAAPKQTKLLGATVKGVGIITTVAKHGDLWALIERADGTEAHVFICDLSKNMLSFPSEQPEYVEMTRRVGYGLFEDAYQLKCVIFSDLTYVDTEERAA